jgi:hypothetical protein
LVVRQRYAREMKKAALLLEKEGEGVLVLRSVQDNPSPLYPFLTPFAPKQVEIMQ